MGPLVLQRVFTDLNEVTVFIRLVCTSTLLSLFQNSSANDPGFWKQLYNFSIFLFQQKLFKINVY